MAATDAFDYENNIFLSVVVVEILWIGADFQRVI